MNTIKPKISIIVPIYNAQKYISRCIQSILQQTFTDFELLLVDDGSTDKSGSICDDYQKIDSRIRVFHKTNGGASSARNLGLEKAYGYYVTFIDSDDWIESDYLLAFNVQNEHYDLCFQGLCIDYERDSKIIDISSDVSENLIDRLLYLENKGIFGFSFVKCFNLEIINHWNIRFDSRLKTKEDLAFTLDYCFYIKIISFSNFHLYHYFQRADSLIHSSLSFDEIFQRENIIYEKRKKIADLYHSSKYLCLSKTMYDTALICMIPLLYNPIVQLKSKRLSFINQIRHVSKSTFKKIPLSLYLAQLIIKSIGNTRLNDIIFYTLYKIKFSKLLKK